MSQHRPSRTRLTRHSQLSLNPMGDAKPATRQDSFTTAGTGTTTRNNSVLTLSMPIDKTETVELDGHMSNVLQGLEVMWRQFDLCDLTLLVDGSRFRVHRTVLATCCDFFHEQLTSHKNTTDQHQCHTEIALEGISSSTMKSMLECMYTGRLTLNEANVRDLLSGAANLQFFAVEEACGQFLKERLSTHNSLRMLNLAFAYNLNELADRALQLAAQNFMITSEGFDYMKMDVDQFLMFLARDDIATPSELDVFRRALAWIEHDPKSRRSYCVDILQQIRLPLIAPSAIVDHVETVDFLMEMPLCQRLVKEALHYHCLPARQSILQTPRTCPRSQCKRNVILCVGGAPRLKTDKVSNDIQYYDLENGNWQHLTTMKEPRHHHAVAVLGGFLYIAGGEQTNDQRSPLNTAYRYDPRCNVWLQIASMKHSRESFQLGVLNGMLYAVGEYVLNAMLYDVGGRVDQDISLATVERYNPAVDEWETVAPLSTARRSIAVAGHGGRLYAMGGSGHRRISGKVERYNPLTNQWEPKRNLSTPRFFAHLVPVGSRLFLLGGATLDNAGNIVCMRKVEYYSPANDTWVTVSSMSEPRAEFGCTVLKNKIYIVGGYSWDKNKRLDSAEAYDCDKDRWCPVPPIATAYTGVACCAITLYDQSIPGKKQLNFDEEEEIEEQSFATPVKASSVA